MSKPNIVIVLADDTGYGDVSCYNPESLIDTPAIDKLASEGVRFTDAHSPCALCTPSRYGIITGRHYWRTPKMHALVMPYEPPVIEPERPTLPGMLKNAGYGTACVGKWHLGFDYHARNRGYTQIEKDMDFSRTLDGGPTELGFDYFFGTAGCSTSDPPYCFIENNKTESIPSMDSPEEFHGLPGFFPGVMADDWSETDVDKRHVEKAVEFIDNHIESKPEDPFFLYLAISAPHNPWLPPEYTEGVSREGPRGDMGVLVDWCVDQVYEALSARGILENTLLIFTSDNGPMKGQNGQKSSGNLRDYKNTAFEGGHRIPFIARWPGKIEPGTVRDETISLIDFYATFAELLGHTLDSSEAEDSYSVLDSLYGNDEFQPRPVLISDTGGHSSKVGDFAVRVGDWKLIVLAPVDTDNYARKKKPPEDAVDGKLLFNLDDDPSETTNLVTKYPDVVDQLAAVLESVKARGSRFINISRISI
ncbi:MAG: arylsulfatase [Spirochaetales bacterium]|jgi:arylsulfatase A|nr:arylsulfatase [Spirochaetales bacterium]